MSLHTGDGSVVSTLTRVHSLGSEHGSDLGLVLGEPGDCGDGAGNVGQSDRLVLSDDELLLGGELGQARGQGSQAEEDSYVLHLRGEELELVVWWQSLQSYLVNVTVNPLSRLY